MSSAVVLLLACWVALAAVSTAYPTRWDPCFPPSSGQGNHLDANGGATPLTDRAIKVVLTQRGRARTFYCPGATYRVKITWPTSRHAFITTKLGAFTPNDGCSGKRYRFNDDQFTKSWTATLRVPCSAKGANVIRVVTAESAFSPYRQNTITVRRGSVAGCKAFRCPGGKFPAMAVQSLCIKLAHPLRICTS